MINKDSIVTAYDEHLTLVEWLQKVENALNNAVLTNLGIAKLSDKDNVATYQVTATFADNTTIASDSFTLPSTDIVTAFNNLTTLVKGFDSRITNNTKNVNSILDIIDIANDKIKADVLKNSINGDDDVIVEIDNDENNEKLGIHLSPELTVNTITANTIKTDSYLKPASIEPSEGDITLTPYGQQANYFKTSLAHWRVSNGKLNVVILCGYDNTSSESITKSDSIMLAPQTNYIVVAPSVMAKLYPFAGSILTQSTVTGFMIKDGVGAISQTVTAYGQVIKSSPYITIWMACNEFTLAPGQKIAWRFEWNFIL